jgi:GNAT superfamily N-acetyltransferase
MNIRLMARQDIPAAMRLKDMAGWNQTSADWERFLSANPEGCFKAENEGRLVGTVTTIIYEDHFGWIGMVLVEPRFRGRGIGRSLLEEAIEYLDLRNIPCIKLDATPQGKPLYEKLGFVTEYDIERWVLKKPPNSTWANAASPKIEMILNLDREVFGADRGSLLRSISESAPEFVQIPARPTAVTGYAFGRRGSLADSLGPWIARNERAAATLLDSFLARSSRELAFVDCLKSNPWAIRLVKARGFEFGRPLTRMYRGENSHPGRTDLVCGILGPEFG